MGNPAPKRRSIGFFSVFFDPPNVTDAYYERTMLGIVYGSLGLDADLVMHCAEGLCEEGDPSTVSLWDPGLGGVLLMCPHLEASKIGFLKRLKYPLVLLFAKPRDMDFACVDLDNRRGARQVMDHLLALGHRRIAYIGGHVDLSVDARERYETYRESLAAAGLSENPDWVHHGAFWVRHGYDSMKKILALPADQRPTAIFGGNDTVALGVLQAASEAGMRVPEDFSVVGFDDIPAAQEADPPLTTVRQPFYEMGQKAVQLLGEMMADPAAPKKRILVEPALIVRGSTAPPSTRWTPTEPGSPGRDI